MPGTSSLILKRAIYGEKRAFIGMNYAVNQVAKIAILSYDCDRNSQFGLVD